MTVHFWGVRGSVPVPGAHTVRYGGNTSCISIELDESHTLVLDAGTGIRALGVNASPGRHTYYLVFTHLHWDHIQGLPFFNPKMDPDVTIQILCDPENDWARHILSQMDGIRFPLKEEQLLANIFTGSETAAGAMEPFGIQISRIRTNHPGVCFGYRLETERKAFVYLTDNEIHAPEPVHVKHQSLVEFCAGSDFLVHDAQYVESDMPAKRGWGHSLVTAACDLAADAGVRHLILFHHDPDRTDSEVDALLATARSYLATRDDSIRCDAACEGLELDL